MSWHGMAHTNEMKMKLNPHKDLDTLQVWIQKPFQKHVKTKKDVN